MNIVESNRCYTPHTLTCIVHKNYPNVAQALYHNKTIVLCVYFIVKYASANADIEREKKKTEESGPPVCLDQRRRHLEI